MKNVLPLILFLILALISCTAIRGQPTSISDPDLHVEIESKLDLGNLNVEQTAATIARDYPGEFSINQASAIYSALVDGWYYYNDPVYKESYKNANKTLQDGKIAGTAGVGDCDDFAILISSLIQSLGGSTRIVFAQDEETGQGHAYAELYLGKKDSPLIDDIKSWIKDEYVVASITGINDADEDTWLNLDYNSSYPGGPYFGGGSDKVSRKIAWESQNKTSPKIVPIIDSMDSLGKWEILKDDIGSNASIDVVPFPSKKGKAINLSYNLKEGGWIGIRRPIDPGVLSEVKGLNFSILGMEKKNTIKLELEYEDGTEFGVSWTPSMKAGTWSSLQALYDDFTCLGTEEKCDLNGSKLDPKLAKKIKIYIMNEPGAVDETGSDFLLLDHFQGVMAVPLGSPWARAEDQRRIALAQNLTAQAKYLKGKRADLLPLSTLINIESINQYPYWENKHDLYEDLALLPYPIISFVPRGDVTDIAFDPNGRYLATVSKDEAQLWDLNSGLEIFRINGSKIYAVTFSPDGKILAIGSEDSAKLWNLSSGKELLSLEHASPLVDLVFSPDGKCLATECRKNTTYLWDVKSGRELKRFEHNDILEALTFSPDGKYLAIASFDHKALIWDLDRGEKVWERKLASFAASLDYSPDGRYLAIASGYEAFVLNLTNNMEVRKVIHDNTVNDVEFSPDGNNIATASCDNTARLWNINTGREVARMVHSDFVNSLTFSPDGKYIATASKDGTARIWEAAGWEGVESFRSKVGTIDTALMSPDGRYLLTSVKRISTIWNLSGDEPEIVGGFYKSNELNFASFSPHSKYLALNFFNRTTLILNLSSGSDTSSNSGGYVARLEDEENLSTMAFSLDNRMIATASMDNVTKIFDLLNGEKLLEIPLDNLIKYLAFNRDTSRIIIVTLNGDTYVHDLNTGQRIGYITKKNVDIRGAILSPGARYLAINYYNDTRLNKTMALNWVDVYDLETGNTTMVSAFEPNLLALPVFSPDGKYLMALSSSNVIIWDVATGEIIRKISDNRLADGCAMSPDNKYLAIAYLDYPSMQCTTKIWELESGRELFVIPGDAILRYLFFTPDGRYLATITLNGEFRLWPIYTEGIIKETCARLNLNTTLDEWHIYLGNVAYRSSCDCIKGIKSDKRLRGTSAPLLEATPTLVKPGDKITLKYYGAPGNKKEYILICPMRMESEKCYSEFYPLNETTSGELTFTAPEEIGRYQFRLLPNSSLGFDEIALSNPISVVS